MQTTNKISDALSHIMSVVPVAKEMVVSIYKEMLSLGRTSPLPDALQSANSELAKFDITFIPGYAEQRSSFQYVVRIKADGKVYAGLHRQEKSDKIDSHIY